jgi:hypothetical protein
VRAAAVSEAAVTQADTAQLSITEFKPGRSRETAGRLEDMLRLAARAAFALVHSVATIMAERLEAIRHAEVPASVAEAFTAAAEAFTAAAVMVVAVAVNMAGVYRLRRKNLRREWMLCDQRS